MKEEFQLLDAPAAQAFIRRFSPESQRRGHAKFGEGAVEDLVAVEPGRAYSATVRDSAWRNEVVLSHDTAEGWSAKCTCPLGSNCAHVYAVMSAVLAEHRMTLVRQLSTGQARSSESVAALKAKPEPPKPESLAERLKRASGSSLSQEAQRFLRQLRDVYVRCSQKQHLHYWDFQQLGFALPLQHFEPIQLWPVPPKNDTEFWWYVANFLHEQGVAIPDFMAPVTDFSEINQRVTEWRRQGEIERWKRTFSRYQPGFTAQLATGEADLRVVLEKSIARLHWRTPGQQQFEPLRQSHYRQLEADYHSGAIHFSPEAELIWQLFSRPLSYGIRLEIGARRPELMQALNRLFRSPALESRVFSSTGKPLLRAPEPLRWDLRAAEDGQGDYRMSLVQPDGSPPPEILCVLAGTPVLYVTEACVFAGPEPVDSILKISEENRIPAPAIEQTGGLVFLQALGCQLPEHLRERIRTLPYRVEISCALAPAYVGAETEECIFKVQAEAPDGHEVSWDGDSWLERRAGRAGKRKSADSMITIYDTQALRETNALLENLNLKPAPYHKGLSLRLTKKFAETMSNWLKNIPPHITVKLEGELASLTSGEVAGRVKLEATELEIDWFDLRVVLDVADTTLTPAEIKLLLNAKGGYVRLQGKGWRRLQYDLSAEENERLARLGLSPRELSAEPQRLHALQLADDAAKTFLPQLQAEQIQRRASEIRARVAPPVPAGVTAQFRPYQLEGFHFLAYLASNHFGGILADDMGLGKTVQALAWLTWLREGSATPASNIESVLVVCPKSVMDNWQAEATRFAPGLRVKVWAAGQLSQLQQELGTADIHVMNYNQLRLMGESLTSVHWLAVVLDEGQYVKNPGSQTAQIARALKASHRLVLSGTPIENRLLDLWSLMAFAMPGVLGSRTQFAKLYDDKGDPLARRRLASRVRPFLLRRTKAQVAQDLPDRIEEDLFCEMEGEQETLYRAELKVAQQLLLRVKSQKELAQQQFHFLTSLLRLRQICCHPRLVQPGFTGTSAKCDSLLEQLEPLMEEGQKVLVFSQFVQMLDLLRPLLEERNWPVFYLAGQTENRGDLLARFQKAEGPAVFLISLKAGGFGLNLTAASYVVLFDPWWNPAVENQAIDRTHRIGQVNKVIAYRLLIKNSIEEKIRALQKQKRALVEDVFGEEKFAQTLTLDDLKFLLAG